MWQILNSVKPALTEFKVKPSRKETMAQIPPFEIPERLRELTERNIEEARLAYSQLMDAMVKSTGMWMAAVPSNGLTAGFKTFQDRAVLFAKQNAKAGFAVASELTNAKSIQDLLANQSRYALDADAGLRSSGAGVRPADGGSRTEYSAKKLKPAAADPDD